MKDDRILKPRLRLCPFCGEVGYPELMTSAGAAFVVRCNICRAEGPWFDICEYLPEDLHDMTFEEQDREWINAKIAAQHNAMKAWNDRPWEGSYFPEELEDLDRKMKQESGALYGSNARNALDTLEADPCGD